MATIISFSQAKKKISQIKKEKQASENRAKFGQSKAEKNRVIKENKKIEKDIDKHQLESRPENDQTDKL